jgi:putative FmdB family regulatory protein
MPTYEYECRKCGHRFEEFQSISEPPLKACPECGGKVRRLIGSGAGILFKGSGFYQTDYRSSSYRKAEQADRGGGEDSSSKSGPSKKETSSNE